MAAKKLKGFSTGQSNGLIAASTKPPSSDGGGKFIKAAIKHPGALHRAVGVPIGTKIPVSRIKTATKSPDKDIARKARLALTLEGIGK